MMSSKHELGLEYTVTNNENKTLRDKSRKKIIKHITKRGSEPIVVTPDIVRYWWRLLNFGVFDGMLPKPRQVICKDFKLDYIGWCDCYPYTQDTDIGIKRTLQSRQLMLETIAHEMVHQWQWIYMRRLSHGESFQSWRRKIKRRVGITIEKEVDI